MARHETPLDPDEGVVQSFAHDLRALRKRSQLTYRQLAEQAQYGRTTLSDAASGRELPTLEVLRAFVRACEGDEDEWTSRWHAVRVRLSAAPADSAPPRRDPLDPELRDLAEEVRRLWVRQVLDANPTHTVPLELFFAEQPDALRDTFGTTAAEPRPLPPGTRLATLLADRFNRRCLLLGEPGAGKTTALLELASDLLDGPEVPVVLPLSQWSDPQDGLQAWVVREMVKHYKVNAECVPRWLADGSVVLLLDGLDEVRPEWRAACVSAVNEFRTGSRTSLVVTSRTEDYRDLPVRLELGGAVTVLPLAAWQVKDRLRDPELAALRAAVAADPVLAELLTSPLMLGVAILAYQDNDRVEGLGDAERREHIFDEYLDRMTTGDRTLRGRTGPGGDVRTPLESLARLMNRRGETIFYPDWFTPAWLPDEAGRRLGRRAVALTCGLVAGVVLGVAYALHALLGDPDPTDSTTLAVSPLFGLLVAVFGCVGVTTALAVVDRAGRLRIPLCVAVFVLATGAMHGVIIWRDSGFDVSAGVAAWLGHGLLFGLIGVASVLFALTLARWLLDLGPGWRDRVARAMFTGLAVAPALGAANAIAYGVTHHDTLGPTHAVLFGLGQGLSIGLIVGITIGLAFTLVDLDRDQPAARWRWSTRRLGAAGFAAVIYLATWLLVFAGVQVIVGPAIGAVFGLLVGLIFWLTFALGYGLVGDRTELPPAPARALSASLRAAVRPTLVTAVVSVLVVALAAGLAGADVEAAVRQNVTTPVVLAATLTFWFTGGGVWLAHHVERFVAWRAGLLPWDLLGFLAQAEERRLLRRAGGGYQFLHLTLQEHIANPGRRGTPR
jgi:transcriptional regulator with XRE-family HTH domain